jgi:hypothetical protein
MAAAIKDGDNPAAVAKVIVAAATDPNPELRYTSGTAADRVSTLRRIAPPGPSASRSANSTDGRLTRRPPWPPTAPPLSHFLTCPEPGASYRSYRQQTGRDK